MGAKRGEAAGLERRLHLTAWFIHFNLLLRIVLFKHLSFSVERVKYSTDPITCCVSYKVQHREVFCESHLSNRQTEVKENHECNLFLAFYKSFYDADTQMAVA